MAPSATLGLVQNSLAAVRLAENRRACSKYLVIMMYQVPSDMITRMISTPREMKSPPFHSASRPYGLDTCAVGVGASAAGAAPLPGGGFVDMDPFKSLALPLIARLFPAATVVHVRRDPRDVVWSCFRRSFVAGPVAAEFTTIARAAAHYAATMRLIDTCRTALPLAIHDLRYEQLVADFDGTTQRLCATTGIAGGTARRGVHPPPRPRRVKTASAAQVRQPLFDGSGQWRRDEKYFTAALPVLAPWV